MASPPSESFTSFEIADRLGIKYQTLRVWLDMGFIKPSFPAPKKGKGNKRLFSRQDAYRIRLFSYLIERGFSREEARHRITSVSSITSQSKYMILRRQAGSSGGYLTEFHPPDLGDIVKIGMKGKTVDGKVGEFFDVLILNFEALRKEVDKALG
jgi:DNA-binding transcriptional MerR regulator